MGGLPPRAQGPIPIHFAYLARHGPVLIHGAFELGHRCDLGHVAGQENLVCGTHVVETQHAFMHLDPICGQVGDVARAGNARQEGAVGNRCKDFAIPHDEDIGGGAFGDIAQGVGGQGVGVAFDRASTSIRALFG